MTKKKLGKGARYPETIMMLARDYYIKGFQYVEIAKKVAEVTSRSTSPIIVSKWAKKYKWEEDRVEFMARALESAGERNVKLISNDVIEQTTAYRSAWMKGLEELVRLGARDAGQAVEMIDKGIKGERQITLGVLALRFLQEIVKVIREEVTDLEVCNRIASKLKAYVVEETTS